MRARNALATVALFCVMVLLSGCCTFCCPGSSNGNGSGNSDSTGADGPWLRPGVVRIERDGTLIGFMSPDPSVSGRHNWILNGPEVLPLDVAFEGRICFKYLNSGQMTHAQLCANPLYGGQLSNPRKWTTMTEWSGGSACGQ